MPIPKESPMYSVDEIAKMDEHAELINGELIITNRTTVQHNRFLSRIRDAAMSFISKNGRNCEVFTENIALFCKDCANGSADELYLPDIMIVCDNEIVYDDGVHGTPEFVSEITSESTRRNDYTQKMITYTKIGVKTYLIIDLQKKCTVSYASENGYVPEFFIHPEIMRFPTQGSVFQIRLEDLW